MTPTRPARTMAQMNTLDVHRFSWSVTLLAFVMLLWAMLLGAMPVSADGGLCTPLLVPQGARGFVALPELSVQVEVACSEGSCTATSEQRLYLENLDEVEPAELTLGLVEECPATIAALSASAGELVQAGETYRLTLEPRATTELSATIIATTPATPIVTGSVLASVAGRWGTVDYTHIELSWQGPAVGPDVSLSPTPDAATSHVATWDWEQTTRQIDWAILSPAVQAELNAAALADDPVRLAEALIAASSPDAPLPAWRDTTPRILAALQDGLDADPGDTTARWLLARQYLTLSDQEPDRRLNYLLLAIQQLEALPEGQSDEAERISALTDALYEAALAAHEAGDPASALAYLGRAAEVAPSERIRRAQDEFVLLWGLDLARQGHLAEAIVLLDESGQLPTAHELVRFAPPLEHASINVSLEPDERTVQYEFSLYAPAAEETNALIDQGLAALRALPGVRLVETTDETTRRAFALIVPFADLDELSAQQQAIVDSLQVYGGLVSELIAAPWRGTVGQWGEEQDRWQNALVYQEQVDLSAVLTIWQTEADYAHWWLVELQAQQSTSEADAAATELTMLALREQTALWESLPENTRWTYSLDDPDLDERPQWQLSTGEQRELSFRQTWYDWRQIGLMAATAVAGLLLIIVLTAAAARRRSQRRRSRSQDRDSKSWTE